MYIAILYISFAKNNTTHNGSKQRRISNDVDGWYGGLTQNFKGCVFLDSIPLRHSDNSDSHNHLEAIFTTCCNRQFLQVTSCVNDFLILSVD